MWGFRGWIAAGVMVGLAGLGGIEEARGGIIHQLPDGPNEAPRSQYLGWDLATGETFTGNRGRDPLVIYSSDHGDLHFDPDFVSIVTDRPYSMTAAKLQPGDLIGAEGPFTSPFFNLVWTTRNGHFHTGSSGMVGFRFLREDGWHFGWAELAFHGTHHAIQGWAFESQPNRAIQAGQTQASGMPGGGLARLAAVPEPATFATLGLGALLTACGGAGRRRRNRGSR